MRRCGRPSSIRSWGSPSLKIVARRHPCATAGTTTSCRSESSRPASPTVWCLKRPLGPQLPFAPTGNWETQKRISVKSCIEPLKNGPQYITIRGKPAGTFVVLDPATAGGRVYGNLKSGTSLTWNVRGTSVEISIRARMADEILTQ